MPETGYTPPDAEAQATLEHRADAQQPARETPRQSILGRIRGGLGFGRGGATPHVPEHQPTTDTQDTEAAARDTLPMTRSGEAVPSGNSAYPDRPRPGDPGMDWWFNHPTSGMPELAQQRMDKLIARDGQTPEQRAAYLAEHPIETVVEQNLDTATQWYIDQGILTRNAQGRLVRPGDVDTAAPAATPDVSGVHSVPLGTAEVTPDIRENTHPPLAYGEVATALASASINDTASSDRGYGTTEMVYGPDGKARAKGSPGEIAARDMAAAAAFSPPEDRPVPDRAAPGNTPLTPDITHDVRGEHPDLVGSEAAKAAEKKLPRNKTIALNKGVAVEYQLRVGNQGVVEDEATARAEGRRQDGKLAITVDANGRILFNDDTRNVPADGTMANPVIEQQGDRLIIRRGKNLWDSVSVNDVMNGKARVRFPDVPFTLAIRDFDNETGMVQLQKENLKRVDQWAQKLSKMKGLDAAKRVCVAAAMLVGGKEMITTTAVIDDPESGRPGISQVVENPQPQVEVQSPQEYTEYKWEPEDVKSVNGFIDAQIALAVTPKAELEEKFGLTKEQVADLEQKKPVYLKLSDEKVNYQVAKALRDYKQKEYTDETTGEKKVNTRFDELNEEYDEMKIAALKTITDLNGTEIYDPADRMNFKTNDTGPTVVKFAAPEQFRMTVSDIVGQTTEAKGFK